MEGLVDPRVFETHAGFVVGVALLAVLLIAIAVGYVAEAVAKRSRRGAEHPAGEEGETEQTRKAA